MTFAQLKQLNDATRLIAELQERIERLEQQLAQQKRGPGRPRKVSAEN